jgi:hypothetical protein
MTTDKRNPFIEKVESMEIDIWEPSGFLLIMDCGDMSPLLKRGCVTRGLPALVRAFQRRLIKLNNDPKK